MTLRISETFWSFQGEGVHMGRSAFFIRTWGCPVRCHWCDSAGTWDPERDQGWTRRTVDQLVEEVTTNKQRPEFVVLTGGEPTVQDIAPLVACLHMVGLNTHLETSGIRPPNVLASSWVTLSPKRDIKPVPEAWGRADEIKIIVDSPTAVDEWMEQIRANRTKHAVQIWLHPQWTARSTNTIRRAIIDAIGQDPRLRAGWQIHKEYAADQFDPRAKPQTEIR